MAQRRFSELNPTSDPSTNRPRRVSEIEHGTLSGGGQVRYRDRVEPRRLMNEPGYRAEFEFVNPDGNTSREMLYFLQGCANDVTFEGKWLTGFTFTPATADTERVVVPAPAVAVEPPEPTPVESPTPEPIQHPATVIQLVREAASNEDLTTLEIGDQLVALPAGCRIRIDKETTVRTPGGDEIVYRKRPRRVTKPKPAVAQAASNE